MTGFGHSFTGISVGLLCMPADWARRKKLGLLALCALLANLPDLPLPGWGHFNYRVSHSLFVNLALILAAALGLAAWQRARAYLGGWRVITGLAAAWLSHLLLDSFYNHGRGVRIYWPLSDASLDLGLPWFSVLPGWGDPAALRVFGVEIFFYGALVLLCLVARWLWIRRPAARGSTTRR